MNHMTEDIEFVLKTNLQSYWEDALNFQEGVKDKKYIWAKGGVVTLSMFARGYAQDCGDLVPIWKVQKWIDEVEDEKGAMLEM